MENLKTIQTKIATPEQWGFGERLVPDMLAEDIASKKILNLNIRNYQIAAKYVQDKQVLDIACGSGYGTHILSCAGANNIIAVDLCFDAIEYAKQRYPSSQIQWICANAENFDWKNQFDVVVSFETIEHLHQPKQFLQKMYDLLIPKGEFLLSIPLGETRHYDPYHLHAFTQKQIMEMLEETGFEVELYRHDNLFINRYDLQLWKQLYPSAPQPSISDLIFTNRGRKFLQDFLFKGGISIPQLLILNRKTTR